MTVKEPKTMCRYRKLAIVGASIAIFGVCGCGTTSRNAAVNPLTGIPLNGGNSSLTAAVLSVSNPTLNFGNVLVGTATAQLVSLTNTGSTYLKIASVAVSGNGYSVSGDSGVILTPNQSVTLSVNFGPTAAGNAAGVLTVSSNASNPIVQIVIDGSGVTTPPGTHSVGLSWTPSTSQVSGYFIYRSTISGGPYTKLNATIDPNPSYVDTGLASGTYYYVVTSVDSNGVESGFSNEVLVTIP